MEKAPILNYTLRFKMILVNLWNIIVVCTQESLIRFGLSVYDSTESSATDFFFNPEVKSIINFTVYFHYNYVWLKKLINICIKLILALKKKNWLTLVKTSTPSEKLEQVIKSYYYYYYQS